MESEFVVESCFSRYHVYKTSGMRVERNCRASGNKKDPYAVAVMRRRTIVGHVPRKISAACSPFLADQLCARCFWQIRDRGTIVL